MRSRERKMSCHISDSCRSQTACLYLFLFSYILATFQNHIFCTKEKGGVMLELLNLCRNKGDLQHAGLWIVLNEAVMRCAIICRTHIMPSLRLTPLTQAGSSICYQFSQGLSLRGDLLLHQLCFLVFFLFLMKTVQNQYDTACVCRKQTNTQPWQEVWALIFNATHSHCHKNPESISGAA